MSFEDIIQQVQGRPEIWQCTHPLYHNKEVRKRIWRQISKELNTNEQLIKKRWKHLMDQYRKELKKMHKQQALYNGEPVPCTWLHFDSLAFLKDEMAMRKERDRQRAAGSDSDERNQEEDRYESVSFKASMMEEDEAIAYQAANYQTNFVLSTSYETTKPEATIDRPASTSAGISKADLILKRLQNLSMVLAKNQQKEELKNDEDYLFLMSVLPTVRNLPPVKKLQFRSKVNEFLLQAMTGEADPLNNEGHYVPVEEVEDNKEVLKRIMETDGNDSS